MVSRPKAALCPLSAAILLAISSPAFADSFTVADGEVVTTPQVLNDNETGTIEAGGELNTAARAINALGDTVTIKNNGSISTTSSLSYGIHSTGSDATINNSGSITTSGGQAHGIYSNDVNATISNNFGGSISTSAGNAYGVYSSGNDATINNSGSVTTSGTFAYGIRSSGSNATIDNSGSINTNAVNSHGIFSSGNDATINNSGSINTNDDNARGIASSASNANITNTGNIFTEGLEGEGIRSTGDDVIIQNFGNITTQGEDAHGIHTFGSTAHILNSGLIDTSGLGGHGIRSEGNDANVQNDGSITTSNDNAHGIYSTGANANILNNGLIEISGSTSNGIRSEGGDAMINNTGNIKTSGGGTHAIYSTGANANMVNDGLIHTTGDSAVGIFSTGDNAAFTNNGVVSTEGDYSFAVRVSRANANITNNGLISTSGGIGYGILASGLDATITNTGTIQTTGEAAIGIRTTTTNATIHNSGAVSTTGANSHAITIVGRDSTINNSGLISATGEGAYAILGESNAQDLTLNLLAGSQIIGRIDLGGAGDNDTANVYAGGMSSQLTFENTENINVFGNGVLNGNTVTTVDATGESAPSVALSGMTSSIHGVINQRMNHAAPLKPVQLASLELSDGMYFEEQRPVAWSQVFGGTMDRDATGSAMAYGYDHAGINFGYEWDMAGHRVGVLGGLVRGKTESELASFETESDNYYVGAYANRKAYGLNITGSLLAGYGDNDNDRLVVDNLNGFETASADFSSWFISPGISIGSAFDIADRLEFRPSVSVNYSIAWLDSYTEKGTTNANLSVDDRKLQALTARAQLAAAYQLSDTSEFELRAGVNSRHTNDDDTKVGIAGSQFRFANAGDESVTGGFAGAALRVMNDNNFTLIADVEFGGNSDEDYAAGSLTLQYAF